MSPERYSVMFPWLFQEVIFLLSENSKLALGWPPWPATGLLEETQLASPVAGAQSLPGTALGRCLFSLKFTHSHHFINLDTALGMGMACSADLPARAAAGR